MFSIQKRRCSWSLVAAIASLVAVVSVIHLFLFPVVPSFDYFSARQVQNSCLPVNGSDEGGNASVMENPPPILKLDVQFPADLHKAVVYRDAPWKAAIGRWLAGCNSVASAVKIVEVLEVVILKVILIGFRRISIFFDFKNNLFRFHHLKKRGLKEFCQHGRMSDYMTLEF